MGFHANYAQFGKSRKVYGLLLQKLRIISFLKIIVKQSSPLLFILNKIHAIYAVKAAYIQKPRVYNTAIGEARGNLRLLPHEPAILKICVRISPWTWVVLEQKRFLKFSNNIQWQDKGYFKSKKKNVCLERDSIPHLPFVGFDSPLPWKQKSLSDQVNNNAIINELRVTFSSKGFTTYALCKKKVLLSRSRSNIRKIAPILNLYNNQNHCSNFLRIVVIARARCRNKMHPLLERIQHLLKVISTTAEDSSLIPLVDWCKDWVTNSRTARPKELEHEPVTRDRGLSAELDVRGSIRVPVSTVQVPKWSALGCSYYSSYSVSCRRWCCTVRNVQRSMWPVLREENGIMCNKNQWWNKTAGTVDTSCLTKACSIQ